MLELLYVDTSAVLDRALGHKRHLEIAAAMRDHASRGGRLVASRLMHLEARRALAREHLRGHDVSPVLELAAEISPLPVIEDVWAGADSIDRHTKALDAIHLATCKLVDAALLSTDHAMLQVAGAMGITVHPASSPWDQFVGER